ncbi:unnamed protein product [Miscanthus lutarioriparius]|uniref:F-box domain-containing protein n=1 Tax=Miscanthus lutarioriparius TaxID=422564 RepID=A0A811QG17_9POAL|nr:unnamed protein product [Miscanthus lutarioriparius]
MANAASSASSLGAGPSFSPPPPPPPPAALPEELIEEILLRFPPGEPASLLRTALVCKRWRPLVSGPGFRRRFGEFHRTPPMLGMFCSGCSRVYRHFEPTTAFRPCHAERAHKRVLDARHVRVLLRGERRALVVWNPITDEARKVPLPRSPPQYMGPLTWTAAVLCSSAGAGGCDHLDCHHGPFIVVVVRSAFGTAGVVETLIFTYSSDVAAWSEPICDQLPAGYIRGLVDPRMRSALVGNALYFGFMEERTALTYNMQSHQMSWIQLPPSVPLRRLLLTTTEDGGLGLATEHESKLYVWSRKDADEVDARWEQSRVIEELKMLLPVDADFTSLVGSTDDLGIIFHESGQCDLCN